MTKRIDHDDDALFCSPCCKQFAYRRSKFARHLTSATHIQFSQSLGISPAQQFEQLYSESEPGPSYTLPSVFDDPTSDVNEAE